MGWLFASRALFIINVLMTTLERFIALISTLAKSKIQRSQNIAEACYIIIIVYIKNFLTQVTNRRLYQNTCELLASFRCENTLNTSVTTHT